MPAPLQVLPGDRPGTAVLESLDGAGNVVAAGNLVGQLLVLGKVAQAPTPLPGVLQLYTLDGVTLQYVAAGGVTPAQSVGSLTVTGTFTAQGAANFTGNAGESFTGSNNTGLLFIQNAVSVTAGADILINEAAVGSVAIGIAVTGDANNRFTVTAAGAMAWGPGNAPTDVALSRTGAALLGVGAGSLSIITAGQGLRVKEGSNAKQGTANLTAGTVTVANTSVTATSRIFLTSQVDGGSPGFLRVSTRTPGTSFTILSSSNTDTSTVAYEIFEQG